MGNQVKKIFQVVGTPSESDLAFLPPAPNPARAFVARLPIFPVQTWSTLFPQASPRVTETLDAMIRVNPMHRVDARDAMLLPWFQAVFDEADLNSGDTVTIDWTFDAVKTPTKHWLQNEYYSEFCGFHPSHVGEVDLHPSPLDDGTMAAVDSSHTTQSWRQFVLCGVSSITTRMRRGMVVAM